MKHLHAIIVFSLAFCSLAPANDHTLRLIADTKEVYREKTDRVIRDWVQEGKLPEAETLMQIQTHETRLISNVQLRPELIEQLPLLHLASIQFEDFRHIPGQFIIARARHAGLDLWKDSLKGRSFKRVSVNGPTETLEWERENLLNACVHWMADGNLKRAVENLKKANALQVRAAPSERARYLTAALLNDKNVNLSLQLRSTLPRAQ